MVEIRIHSLVVFIVVVAWLALGCPEFLRIHWSQLNYTLFTRNFSLLRFLCVCAKLSYKLNFKRHSEYSEACKRTSDHSLFLFSIQRNVILLVACERSREEKLQWPHNKNKFRWNIKIKENLRPLTVIENDERDIFHHKFRSRDVWCVSRMNMCDRKVSRSFTQNQLCAWWFQNKSVSK